MRDNNGRGVRPSRDGWLATGLLASAGTLAWAYTAHHAHMMGEMERAMWRDMDMSISAMSLSWTPMDALLVFVMWAVMMAAMMIPGSGPMITAFATINRRRRERRAPHVRTTIFLLGYLIIWAAFAIIATGLQWALQRTGLVTTMMQSASYFFSAALFLVAGVYQFSPLKERCLTYCRSADGFILSEWRDGALGAIVMGMRHGLFCMLCCVGLMLLLFAVAVMDLRWVVGLALLVTAEKLLPNPKAWRVGIGLALISTAVAFGAAGLLYDGPAA